jgi:three-Cys-motif partner protein
LGTSTGGFLPATRRAVERYYLDLFAGPGQNRIRGTEEIIDGSPLIALKAGPPHFTRLLLVDADPDNTTSLEAHRHDFPDRRVTILNGDANQKVDDILRRLPREFPIFAFLDPRGAELRWQTIEKLARHKGGERHKIELFVLFAYNHGLVRLMPHDPARMLNEAALDQVMPDPAGWRRVYQHRVDQTAQASRLRRLMLEEYVRGLRALGYAYVPPPRLIHTTDNHPLYFMVFASDHPAGDGIMTWCLGKVRDSGRQMSFLPYDQRY